MFDLGIIGSLLCIAAAFFVGGVIVAFVSSGLIDDMKDKYEREAEYSERMRKERDDLAKLLDDCKNNFNLSCEQVIQIKSYLSRFNVQTKDFDGKFRWMNAAELIVNALYLNPRVNLNIIKKSNPRIISVTGPAGCGKTKYINEMLKVLEAEKAIKLECNSFDGFENQVYRVTAGDLKGKYEFVFIENRHGVYDRGSLQSVA